ncbi:hypothetical protein IWW38_005134, partial [Coemansia aciculifera]
MPSLPFEDPLIVAALAAAFTPGVAGAVLPPVDDEEDEISKAPLLLRGRKCGL